MFATLATAAFLTVATVAAWSDLTTRRVGNRLVLFILAAGLVRQAASLEVTAIPLGLAGAAVGLALLLPAFSVRWVGGGDVKLLAALGAWLGPWHILLGGVLGIALGGLLAIAMALAGGIGADVARSIGLALATRTSPVAPLRAKGLIVPLAVPLALGCALVELGVVS